MRAYTQTWILYNTKTRDNKSHRKLQTAHRYKRNSSARYNFIFNQTKFSEHSNRHITALEIRKLLSAASHQSSHAYRVRNSVLSKSFYYQYLYSTAWKASFPTTNHVVSFGNYAYTRKVTTINTTQHAQDPLVDKKMLEESHTFTLRPLCWELRSQEIRERTVYTIKMP